MTSTFPGLLDRAPVIGEQLQNLLDTLPDLVWLKDPEGVYLYCNAAFERFSGLSRADLLGKTDYDFADRELADFFRAHDRKAMEAGRPSTNEEWLTFAIDGYRGLFEAIKTPMRNAAGEVIGVLGISREITPLHRVQQALHESEEALARAQAVAHVGSWRIDLGTHALHWSDETYRIFEVEPGTEMSYEFFRSRVHPDDIDRLEAAWQAALGGAGYDITHRILVDGRVKWVHERADLVVDEDGRLLSGVGTVQDVTQSWREHRLLLTSTEALHMIARGRPMQETLEAIAQGLEAINPDMLCSILLLDADGQRLSHGAAPSLPAAYSQAVDGSPIGPRAGSCGTSAYTGKPVYVDDIERDPLWADYAALALAHGLRACWSVPILSSQGKVLGTFAVYYRIPQKATHEDMQLIRHVSTLAGQVIERTRAEDALRESEERYELATKASNLGIWDWLTSSDAVFYSDHWKAQLGYAPDELENSFDTWTSLLHPEDHDRMVDEVEHFLARPSGHFEAEFRLRHKDGGYRWIYNRAAPLLDAQGKVVRLLGTHADITTRKLMELELADSQRRLSYALQGANDGLWDWNLDTNEVYYSPRWTSMLGYSPDELGNTLAVWGELVDPTQKDAVLGHVADYLAGKVENFEVEFRMRHKDGHWVDILSRARLARDAEGEIIHPRRLVGTHVDISDRKRVERALEDSRQRLDYAMAATGEGVWDWDIAGGQIEHNARWCQILGLKDDYLQHPVGQFVALLHEDDREAVWGRVEKSLTGEGDYLSEHRFRRPDGNVVWVLDRGRVVARDAEGRPLRMVGSIQDISERKHAEDQLRLASSVFDGSHSAILITDAEGRIILANPAFSQITGYPPEDVIGRNPSILKSGRQSAAFYEELWGALDREGHWQGELWNRRKDGSEYAEWLSISAVRDQAGVVTHYIGISDDISANKQAQSRIEFLAYHDVLTGLPNRQVAQDRAEQAMAYAHRSGGRLGLLFVDLDQFKSINDTLGHSVGDELLQAVSERLQACVRETDTVSRQGGDEFLILLPGVDEADDVSAVASKLLEKLAVPLEIGGHDLSVTASIGIALYPEDGEDFDALMKKADMAMYSAKEAGRNAYRFFTEKMNTYVMDHILLRHGLLRALEHDEFVLHYQPQVELGTGRMVGAEALIRWQHPELGLLMPGRFISVAEDSGLIVELGNWVLHEACRQFKAWQDSTGRHDLTVSVNISALQFLRGDLEQVVGEALAASGLAPASLELELTESILLKDIEHSLAVIQRFKALGVRMSIDDFGTGYSSLAYLKQLPVDKLKIDRSFIKDATRDADDAAIARAVISLAHILGLEVIAEGVETSGQLAFLGEHGCDQVQGYVYARPLAAEVFGGLLEGGAILTPKDTGS